MRKNHTTTTLLVAMGVIAATLLAAGTVAAVASNHSAFAWKDKGYKKDKYQRDENKYSKEDKSGRDANTVFINKQNVKCIVVDHEDAVKKPEGPKTTLTPTDATGDAIGHDSCNASSEQINGAEPSYTGPPGGGPPGRGPSM